MYFRLEEEVNTWLTENKDKLDIKQIVQSQGEERITISIF
jgi:hypothetical protein